MDRHLSLSQAARLIGVKRKDVQQKIQQNKLRVMEGSVVLSDLKKAFPDAQYEDNTMLEKMEKFMQDAVHKMAQSERDGAQLDALNRRLFKMNKELVSERNRANNMEELLDGMKQKFMQLNLEQPGSDTVNDRFHKIKVWFNESLIDLEDEKFITPLKHLEKQIEQFMQPHIRLLPSHHDYISYKSETLLESALRSGLAVDYGCNNGKCGKCKAKLISGRVEKTAQHDYVFSARDKAQGYILTCSNSAVTDVTLETEEAVSVDDIPLQNITAKIKKIQQLNNIIQLSLKLPRSQRLRFLAGQHIELRLDEHLQEDGQPVSAEYSIASCPCEPGILEFHIPITKNDPFAETIAQHFLSDTTLSNMRKHEAVSLNGPHGNFVLNEDSPNSLIFIAWDTGFAPIRSLIEHAISLDKAESIHLYWLTTKVENHYLNNLCRSWNDALDNFTYTPIVSEPKIDRVTESLLLHLSVDHSHLLNFDLYIAAPGHLNQQIKPLLIEHGIKSHNLHFESIFHGDELKE